MALGWVGFGLGWLWAAGSIGFGLGWLLAAGSIGFGLGWLWAGLALGWLALAFCHVLLGWLWTTLAGLAFAGSVGFHCISFLLLFFFVCFAGLALNLAQDGSAWALDFTKLALGLVDFGLCWLALVWVGFGLWILLSWFWAGLAGLALGWIGFWTGLALGWLAWLFAGLALI